MLSFLTKRGSQNSNSYMLFHLGRGIEDGTNYFWYWSLICKERETFAFFIEFKGFLKSQQLMRIWRMPKGYALFIYRIKYFSRHSAEHYIFSASSVTDFFSVPLLYPTWQIILLFFQTCSSPMIAKIYYNFEHGFILAESILFYNLVLNSKEKFYIRNSWKSYRIFWVGRELHGSSRPTPK